MQRPINFNEMIEKLKEAGPMVNDEMGEWWTLLASLKTHIEGCSDPDFEAAYIKAVEAEYKLITEEYVVEEEIYTPKPQKIKYMKWIHE